jgi:hypothetical protein
MPTTTSETKEDTKLHDELLESLSETKRLIAKWDKESVEKPPADNSDEQPSSK